MRIVQKLVSWKSALTQNENKANIYSSVLLLGWQTDEWSSRVNFFTGIDVGCIRYLILDKQQTAAQKYGSDNLNWIL